MIDNEQKQITIGVFEAYKYVVEKHDKQYKRIGIGLIAGVIFIIVLGLFLSVATDIPIEQIKTIVIQFTILGVTHPAILMIILNERYLNRKIKKLSQVDNIDLNLLYEWIDIYSNNGINHILRINKELAPRMEKQND